MPVTVLADSAPGVALPPAHVSAPAATWELLAISPQRASAPPPVEARPGEPPAPRGEPEALPVDDRLHPPVPREPAVLHVGAARGAVELDVRVDEAGRVTAAEWAGGARDTSLVRAAIASALGMRFYPAHRAGRPVAVWCRQRFDVAR